MKNKLLLTLAVIITCTSIQAQKSEEKLIQKSFDNYKSSILNDKGEEAVKFVDNRTVKYYSEILEKTKHADSIELNTMGIMDKLMVFSIRHRATREEILSFDGKGLLIYAIKEGMVGKNSVSNNAIGDIEIDNAFAKGQLISNGQKVPFYFHFYKEEGTWKIDLTSLFPIGSMALTKMQQESGKDENEFIFMLLEMITGKKPGSEIWNKIE